MESSFLTRDQAMSLWSGSTDSKTLTTRELTLGSIKQWELIQRKPLKYKTQHHPTTSSTLCSSPHLNKKQNKNTNSIISRQDHHFTKPCPLEDKQTNEQNSAQILLYMKLTQNTGPTLGGQNPKGRKSSSLKPGERRPQTQ